MFRSRNRFINLELHDPQSPVYGGELTPDGSLELTPLSREELLLQAKELLEEGGKILEVKQVQIEALELEVARLKVAAGETPPPEAA